MHQIFLHRFRLVKITVLQVDNGRTDFILSDKDNRESNVAFDE